MNAEQAKVSGGAAMTTLWEGEFPATCKVLAAVNNDNRDYKPDAKSRTRVGAGDAPGDGRHLVHRQHRQRQVRVESRGGEGRPRPQFKSVNDVVEFYKKTFPEKLKALRALPADKLARSARLLRHDADAARAVHRLRQQPQHPPPRPAGRVPARDGLEGAEHLRPERRRQRGSVRVSFPDLRAFLEQLHRDRAIVTVDAPVDPHLEVAEIHRRVIAAGGPALLFTNVKGSRFPARHQSVRHARGAPSSPSASGRCA